MQTILRRVNEWSRMAGDWLRQAEGWQLALVALFVLVALPAVPALVLLAVVAAVVLFGRAWVREFTHLMRLDDGAFPGRNDKLIWAVLLIVLPPLGVWMFQTYREAHWPVAKPGRSEPVDF